MPQFLTHELIQQIYVFVLGEPNQMVGTVFLFILLNAGVSLFRKEAFSKTFREAWEKVFAYLTLIIIANRMDAMAVNDLINWEGPTRLIACLYLFARECKLIMTYLKDKYGINIPIINSRLDQMTKLGENEGWDETQPDNTDTRVRRLREELTLLERKAEEKSQAASQAESEDPNG